VDFLGSISNQGSYFSSAGEVVAFETGITALSRGGAFACHHNDCVDHYFKDNVQTPGEGGQVSVILRAGSDINLVGGSAIGVYAGSVNGAIIAEQNDAEYSVDTDGLTAGDVNLTVEGGASIAVGTSAAQLAIGVQAMSAGTAFEVPLSYQPYPQALLFDPGNQAVGGDVTVNTGGSIKATGFSSLGVLGLSLGGEAVVGLVGTEQPGIYQATKKRYDTTAQTLGDVSVTNSGTITVAGYNSIGLLAGSLGSGGVLQLVADWLVVEQIDPDIDLDGDGLLNKDDPDDDGDGLLDYEDPDANNNGIPDFPCANNADPSRLPLCAVDSNSDPVENGAILGQQGDSGGDGVSGGSVTVSNSGSILAGFPSGGGDASEEGGYASGILAQSIGGGGGAGSGELALVHGDRGGAGGNGGGRDRSQFR